MAGLPRWVWFLVSCLISFAGYLFQDTFTNAFFAFLAFWIFVETTWDAIQNFRNKKPD